MAYYSVNRDVYHIYKNCSLGNNIESKNIRSGTGGKRLCYLCKKMKEKKEKKK